jgi:hypothetical protein
MPKELQFSKLLGMRLLHEPILITTQSSTLPLLPHLSIHPFQEIEEQWYIYKTFWRRRRFRQSRFNMLTVIALISSRPFVVLSGLIWFFEAIFGVTEFAYFNFSIFGIEFSGVTIALWVLLFSICLLWFFSQSQEWILEQDGYPIGYIHFSERGNCSILLVTGGMDRQVDKNNIESTRWMLKIWDAPSLTLLKTLQGHSSSSLESLNISSDGKIIVFNDCCHTQLWDWINNKHISEIDGFNRHTVLSPDGTTVVGADSDDKTIAIAKLSNLLQSGSPL